MSIPHIILLVTAAIAAGLVALAAVSWRTMEKNAVGYPTVCRVLYITKVKLPLARYACVEYTRKGKPMQCMTGPIFWNHRALKEKAVYKCMVKTYRLKSKAPLIQAKLRLPKVA